MWLEERFARIAIRFAAFQVGGTYKKGHWRYLGEGGKDLGKDKAR